MRSSVVTDSKILFGKPRIRGTRISVDQVLTSLAEGLTPTEVSDRFGGQITVEDIRACLEYSCEVLGQVRMVGMPSSFAHA